MCTYRLNWAEITLWGWWDEWDDITYRITYDTYTVLIVLYWLGVTLNILQCVLCINHLIIAMYYKIKYIFTETWENITSYKYTIHPLSFFLLNITTHLFVQYVLLSITKTLVSHNVNWCSSKSEIGDKK